MNLINAGTDATTTEETLDPQDWEAVRRLGHRMIDDLVEQLSSVRERPVWQRVPDPVRAALREPLPVTGQPLEHIYEEFKSRVRPYPTGNIHPRFWGWVMGTGTITGAFADLLAAGMNSSVAIFDDAPSLVEEQVIRWLVEAMGFPETGSGLLVSGGSMANLIGLAVARNARAGYDLRQHGVGGAPFTLYASRETHNSVAKAVELLGLGREHLRLLPVDANFRLDTGALAMAVEADRAAGRRPLAVIANAGTVNTGALDPLHEVADLCARERLWLHVDGAFGAMAALSPELRPRVAGLERADSVAFDLHKWGYVPLEVGCVLVRRGDEHRAAFAAAADYLAAARGGLVARQQKFSDQGVQLSRNFRSLKVWMMLKEHGFAKLGRLIAQNVAQARYLAELVDAQPALERLAPVPLNIVCFRYRGGVTDPATLDALNRELVVRLHESGVAVPSGTLVRGSYAVRAAITNHRSRREDFRILVDACLKIGRQLEAETGRAS
ncbi:MAG: pyridoxal-dependent decarboxylase [Vicinamibacteria bacterium]|nr:pyridoxal-dependent decarboxylase [Vicinamibacteria bacterium]